MDRWLKVTNFASLQAAVENSYWSDDANGYCMVKVMGYKTPRSFEKEGLILPEITGDDEARRFTIQTGCGTDACPGRTVGLPSQMRGM